MSEPMVKNPPVAEDSYCYVCIFLKKSKDLSPILAVNSLSQYFIIYQTCRYALYYEKPHSLYIITICPICLIKIITVGLNMENWWGYFRKRGAVN